MRRLLWFKVKDHRDVSWSVWLSSYHWCDELKGLRGVAIPDDATIYIEVIGPVHGKYGQDETLNHELFHGHLEGVRLPIPEYEEAIVNNLSLNYYRTMKRMGWRAPPRPDGYHALARAARRLERAKYPLLEGESE